MFKSARLHTDTVLSARLNAQEQRELQGRMEKKQMKEFMTVSPSPFHSYLLLMHINALFPQLSRQFCLSCAIRCTRGWSKDALMTA